MGIDLEVRIDDSHVVVAPKSDVFTVQQNLISNAVKFTRAPTRVGSPCGPRRSSAKARRSATLSGSRTPASGFGIPTEEQDRVFDSFYQG